MIKEQITWHAVADCLPDSDLTVLVFSELWDDPIFMGWHDGDDGWRNIHADNIEPTHWAELPQGPGAQCEQPGFMKVNARYFHDTVFGTTWKISAEGTYVKRTSRGDVAFIGPTESTYSAADFPESTGWKEITAEEAGDMPAAPPEGGTQP